MPQTSPVSLIGRRTLVSRGAGIIASDSISVIAAENNVRTPAPRASCQRRPTESDSQSAIVASSTLLDTIYSTSHTLLGESAAKNLTAAIAHASKTFDFLLSHLTNATTHTTFADEPTTWQEHLTNTINNLIDFLSTRTALENTSILLALSTFLFLLVRNFSMSWTSKLGNLGRFSPFARGVSTKVSDSDFSYITADDLRRHQAESSNQDPIERTASPVDYGPERDTDMLILKHRRREFPVHFAAYSIAKGELTVGTVREAAAKKTGTSDRERVKLLYKGKNLKDDHRTCKQEGLKDGSEIMCAIADTYGESRSESEEDEDEFVDGGAEGDTEKRRRNRGKKTKRRNKREAAAAGSGTSTPDRRDLDVPLSQQSTRRSPSPAVPKANPTTPLGKIEGLRNTLTSFHGEVQNFKRSPPPEEDKRQFEYKKLSETILTQVLLKLDAVETEGDVEARTKRKELVKDTQAVLQELDAAVKK